MDRRQRKTRTAIFEAFIGLLSSSSYDRITVGQIIEKADVGRATFYAHFETKESLLQALCQELFDHIFASGEGRGGHNHIFDCEAPDSVFLHLLQHLQKNDNHLLDLLSGENAQYFSRYFKEGLKKLVRSQLTQFADRKSPELPQDFWVDHIAATFVETVRWWLENGRQESAETVARYFALAV